MKHLFKLFIYLVIGLSVTSCFLIQSAEGDKHPNYPNILLKHDSLSFPLQAIPIDIPNKLYAYSGDCGKNGQEDVPYFERYEKDGRNVYYGGEDENENCLIYDNTLKLVAKSKYYPRLNVFGQLYRWEEDKDESLGTYGEKLVVSDFYTGKTIDVINVIADFHGGGYYHICHEESMKLLPEIGDSVTVNQYIAELCANGEGYVMRTNYDGRYYVFPKKKIAIHTESNIDIPDVPLYNQPRRGEESEYTGSDFQLIKTETVSHSLYDPGGRGNFLLMMATLYMHYYDFIAGEDTLRMKSFRKLELVETVKDKGRYIVILGEVKDKDRNYFFEYVPGK